MPKTTTTDDTTERTDHGLLAAVSRAHTPTPEHAQTLRHQRQVVDNAVDAGLDVPCLAGGLAWITDTAKGVTARSSAPHLAAARLCATCPALGCLPCRRRAHPRGRCPAGGCVVRGNLQQPSED